MITRSHKDLIVWQKSSLLVEEVYKVTSKLPASEVFGLASQMRRAAVSIPSNIAEGRNRNGLKEYVQFLNIAKGSLAELETQLSLSQKIYPEIDFESASALVEEVRRMLLTMISKLREKLSS